MTEVNMRTLKNTLLKLAGGAALSAMAIGHSFAAEPVWDANTVELELKKIGKGVYAVYDSRADDMAGKGVPMATSSGIIVGEDGVMIVDTMMNERLNKQLFSLVKSVTDKPVKFAVNTSFHGDHSYGNYFLPESVTVIQHSNAKKYVDSHFENDTQFMIQTFGENRGIEDVKASLSLIHI